MVAFNPISNSQADSKGAVRGASNAAAPSTSFLNAFSSALIHQRDEANAEAKRTIARQQASAAARKEPAAQPLSGLEFNRSSALQQRPMNRPDRTVIDRSVHNASHDANERVATTHQDRDSRRVQAPRRHDASHTTVEQRQPTNDSVPTGTQRGDDQANENTTTAPDSNAAQTATDNDGNATTNTQPGEVSNAAIAVDGQASTTTITAEQAALAAATGTATSANPAHATADESISSTVAPSAATPSAANPGAALLADATSTKPALNATDESVSVVDGNGDLPAASTVDALVAALQTAANESAQADDAKDGEEPPTDEATAIAGSGYTMHPLQQAALQEASQANATDNGTIGAVSNSGVSGAEDGAVATTTGTPTDAAVTDATNPDSQGAPVTNATTQGTKGGDAAAQSDGATGGATASTVPADPTAANAAKTGAVEGQVGEQPKTNESTALQSKPAGSVHGVEGAGHVQAAPGGVNSTEATPQAPTARPTMPVPTPQQQLANAIGALRRHGDGTHSATVELHPQELGSVRVDVHVVQGVVHVQLNAQEESTRSLFLQNMDALRESLADAGLSSGNLDVGGQNNGPDQDNPSDGGQRGTREEVESEVQAQIPLPGSTVSSINSGSGLDLKV